MQLYLHFQKLIKLNIPKIKKVIPEISLNAFSGIFFNIVLPRNIPKQFAQSIAETVPVKTKKGLFVEDNAMVASCVLSPSSAMKKYKDIVNIGEKFSLKSFSFSFPFSQRVSIPKRINEREATTCKYLKGKIFDKNEPKRTANP